MALKARPHQLPLATRAGFDFLINVHGRIGVCEGLGMGTGTSSSSRHTHSRQLTLLGGRAIPRALLRRLRLDANWRESTGFTSDPGLPVPATRGVFVDFRAHGGTNIWGHNGHVCHDKMNFPPSPLSATCAGATSHASHSQRHSLSPVVTCSETTPHPWTCQWTVLCR